MRKLIFATVAAAALAAIPATAHERNVTFPGFLFGPHPVYPWCALYAGADGDGGRNCGFTTYAQCRASISGVGGVCNENPAYPDRPYKTKRRAAKQRIVR